MRAIEAQAHAEASHQGSNQGLEIWMDKPGSQRATSESSTPTGNYQAATEDEIMGDSGEKSTTETSSTQGY